MAKVLEVCVDSLASARAAISAGADRLELCSALTIGGLTPHGELLRQIRQESQIPVRCLIRPRAGDFLYTPEEIQMMAQQILTLKAAGSDGFVIGCLNEEGILDEKAMEPLLKVCGDKGKTLHRCIDVSRDPVETYLTAGRMGFDTVLTSGGAGSCRDGMMAISEMLRLREETDGPEVLIGGGVNDGVIEEFLYQLPLSRAFHMSGKVEQESQMKFRREGVPMGAPGLDEWHIIVTSMDVVKAARTVLYR